MKWFLIIFIFLAVLIGHFFYVTQSINTSNGDSPWASYRFEQPQESRMNRYFGQSEYWLGLSYGLAGAFAVFCLIRAIKLRRKSFTASAGGLAFGGLLWAGVCFLVGCCGSPMLPIYLGLLGPQFLGVTKPLTFGITIVSIIISYRLIIKRAKSCECVECQH